LVHHDQEQPDEYDNTHIEDEADHSEAVTMNPDLHSNISICPDDLSKS
jgi:hypothetical protein